MNNKTRLISSVGCLCVTSLILPGCLSQPPRGAEAVCVANDVTTACIIDNAEATLATIQGDYDWITSATELALALDSQGDRSEAWSYLAQAVSRLPNISEIKGRDSAAADIALALKGMAQHASALPLIAALQAYSEAMDSAGKKADVLGKIVTARAVHESPGKARELAASLSQDEELANSYRGRTQREIADIFAKKGDFDSALSLLEDITTDFTYYKAIAQTDVMSEAAKSGHKDIVDQLKVQAEAIANEQGNKYFTAGILRDIGYSYIVLGDNAEGAAYIRKARLAAQQAPKFQEQSRSTSRIATRLADAGELDETLAVLEDAMRLLEDETSQMMVSFSRYEIAGSAAFTNNFQLSEELVNELPDEAFLSATSLRAAGQRDLAWGLVRSGRLGDGVTLANTIASPREKVHAFSRIVRLINDPSMNALPRYL